MGKLKKPVVVGFMLQGRPYMLLDDEDVASWESIEAAKSQVDGLRRAGQSALRAAESIVATNLDDGDCEVLL